MKVLWLCNIMLPAIAAQLGLPCSNKEGWLSGLAARVRRERTADLTLGICFPVSGERIQGQTDNICWYGFPEDTARPWVYDTGLEGELSRILAEFAPDIVHCFGTEYPHTLAMARAFGRPERTLVGIQGLCFVYADAYRADLPRRVWEGRTLRDVLRGDDLRQQEEKYRKRGIYEQEALRLAGHVTGRTDWDREWTARANPAAAYHFMNETLRESFYGPVWDPKGCVPCSIFVSQGNYPIKGLHYLLQAMPEIKRRYPQTRLFVAGDVIARAGTWKERLKLSGYGKYIRELLRTLRLEQNVSFLGRLGEQEMLARFLGSHVFVSPSSIENSPNSVGEAMLLGMPVVSSDVGGVHNMLRSGSEGLLYPPGDIKALTEAVCRIFDRKDREKIEAMGRAARLHAQKTHDPETNYRRLLEIYHEIYLCV